MSVHSEMYHKLQISTIRGINLPIKPGNFDHNFWCFVSENFEEQLRYLKEDFVVRDDDIYICTYPRSGTNWVHEIVQMLIRGSADFADSFMFPEALKPEVVEEMTSPRIFESHVPFRYLPPGIVEKARVICVFRNPKDVAVSYHNYLLHASFIDYRATWNEFLELYIDGDVCSGTWFDHIKGWETVKEEHRSAKILFLKYEDMKSDLAANIETIANFLGVQQNKQLLFEINNKCGFKSMYEEKTTNVHPLISRLTKNVPNFLYRKGEVGDWKNWFTVAQAERFDKIYEERMKDSKLQFRFS